MATAMVKPAHQGGSVRRDASAVPLEVYGSLFDALHEIAASLYIGTLATTIAALITAWWAESWILLGFAVAIAVAASVRIRGMIAYGRARPSLRSAEGLKAWERRYIVGSTVYLAIMGGWCLACFMVSDDPFVRLFGFAGVVAYMVGVSGRNFASNALVTAQILGGGIPLTLSLIYAGPLYYTILVLVLVPFFASVKLISDRLRKQLLDAVISARDITELAARFTTALNNMPHGLLMFDAERKLVVANERLIELLGISRAVVVAGMSPAELLTASHAFSDTHDLGRFAAEFERRLSGVPGELIVEAGRDRWLSLTARPMENGGSVVIAEDVTERRTSEQRIHRLARFDNLTRLPNRNSFHEHLSDVLEMARPEEQFAVLFVDLDEFKQVNDTLGHPAGDALLCAVADRMRTIIAAPDVVARFGGDEFVVLQYLGERDLAALDDLARRIIETVSKPYQIEGQHVIIGASIGAALAPRDGSDPDLLLKNADMALYHTKSNGRGTWRVFDPSMDAEVQAKRALEMDLRRALAEGQFELYYQPLINLRTKRVTTCEALIRWNHPERGLIPPGKFIPAAEDIGIINEMGDWVIRTATKECASWPETVRVAVNLSSVQFRHSRLTAVVAEALAESGLSPKRLEVEITESVLLRDTPGVRTILGELVAQGVRIALDDFGTGYSGLSYLHTFPLNKVKIDRSFVAQLNSGDRSLTLLKGVARLSSSLGLSVAVEGIETQEQLEIIAAEDTVDEVQGYLFSMPLPVAQIRKFIAVHADDSDLSFTGGNPGGKMRQTEAA
ncbi:MAG: EAL domain-containing protein [Bauldia sp.]|nr:EAL domain-containing protein [Bauldia sp.]